MVASGRWRGSVDDLSVADLTGELADWETVFGMDRIGRDLDQWSQHEVAEQQTRMRDLEVRLLQDELAEEQDIEIDGARSVLEAATTFQFDLDALGLA